MEPRSPEPSRRGHHRTPHGRSLAGGPGRSWPTCGRKNGVFLSRTSCQPLSEPLHLRGLPALLSQLRSQALYPTLPYPTYPLSPSSVLVKNLLFFILPKGSFPASRTTSPWDIGSPRDHSTNRVPAPVFSREHGGLRIAIPSPALCPRHSPSPAHGGHTALQVGVSHSRHYVGNCLHVHIVIVQGLWRCLRACLHQEETQPAAQVFGTARLQDRGRVGVHAQLLAPCPRSCLLMQSHPVEKGPLTQSVCARPRRVQEKAHRHMQEVPVPNLQPPCLLQPCQPPPCLQPANTGMAAPGSPWASLTCRGGEEKALLACKH